MEVHDYGLCTYTLGEGNGTPLQYLAWKIQWMEEPGGLQSMGSLRVGHDWVTSLSCLGKGNGNPLQCSCLENPRDGGAWWAAVYGVTQSWTWLKRLSSSSSSYALFFFFFFLGCFVFQFSHSVVPNSLQPHELQHTRPPCPSPTPGVHSNSCPLSQWCHPAISSSIVHFFSCSQSFPASGSFPISQLFAWGGQSTGVSASASVLPMNTQDWSPLGWTSWISLQSDGLSRVFPNTIDQNHQFFSAQLSSQSNSYIHTRPLEKP